MKLSMPEPLPRSRRVSPSISSSEVEVVADAGEGVDGFGRDAVEVGGAVAEPLGQRPAHLEVELAVRVLGDVAVHRLDLGSSSLRLTS